MVHIVRIKIGAVLSFHSRTVVRVWNCTSAKHGDKRKGKPKGSGKERTESERKRALAMASQIPTHCTTSSYPLFFCGNENMYNMLHAPVYGRTGSFGVRKRRATCPSLYPRKFLLRYRAAGRIPLGTLKLKSDEVTEETESEVATGTRKLRSLPGTLNLDWGKTNANLLFVAGATGGVGSRLVRELLKLGFQVRAGVRDFAKGDPLLEPARLFQFLSPPQGRLELTECDLEKEDQIEVALGDAGVVICVVGASEKEVLDVTGPYRIDYKATKNLIDAASAANVKHFILVTSLGTAKFGWPASILNLFWGVLIWKAKAEKALKESGIPYTIVRPGGMERPTDAFKETHNLVLYRKDSLSGGQVSRLQVAELIACCVSNPHLSKNKVLEAIAETTAPLRPIEELLSVIPLEDVHYPLPESEPQLPKLPLVNGPVSTISDDQPPLSSQPLSPYTRYPDLKPPASPTPQAPTSGNERSEAIKEDLKLKETQWSLEEKVALVVDPASTEDVKERARLAKEAAEEAAARAALALEKAKSVATFSWPWKGEEALASSSFVTKNMSQSASASTNLPSPPRPLSPYTRYQDLKPPASPTPSPPKVVKLVNLTLAPAIKVKKSSNGAGEQQEKQELETANQSGFKWPWQA
ncbi:unnamed protein product [Sphagnum compactum]